MQIEEVAEGLRVSIIITNPDWAVLIVHSTIGNLSFESNRGIVKVDKLDQRKYLIYLYAGSNWITFKANGYLPIKQSFYIEKKNYKEIKIIDKTLEERKKLFEWVADDKMGAEQIDLELEKEFARERFSFYECAFRLYDRLFHFSRNRRQRW
jgi:hypothetical protein